MKSMEIKSYNLPSGRLINAKISARPNLLFLILFSIAIISFFIKIPVIYGISTIAIVLIALAFMPSVTLMEFYDDYLVMFNKADKNVCQLIFYDEVTSWYYNWGASHDFLYIQLEDGSVEKIEAFSKTLFEKYMNRFLKDKHKKVSK